MLTLKIPELRHNARKKNTSTDSHTPVPIRTDMHLPRFSALLYHAIWAGTLQLLLLLHNQGEGSYDGRPYKNA